MDTLLERERTRLERLLMHITYKKGWTLHLTTKGDVRLDEEGKWPSFYIYWCWEAVNSDELSQEVIIKGRLWPIEPRFTDDEIIQTVYLAVKVSELHEVAEFFRVRGVKVFDPHTVPLT